MTGKIYKYPNKCSFCKEQYQTHNKKGLYCSNKCQQDHAFDQRYKAWLEGSLETYSRWLRRALGRLHGYKCSECKIFEWNSKSIVLEVEHIDGNSQNNSISNLCLICPNCHSQTPTYKARNRGNGRHARRIRYANGQSY
jgi:hypothetical protein